jgi:hypothetical protein
MPKPRVMYHLSSLLESLKRHLSKSAFLYSYLPQSRSTKNGLRISLCISCHWTILLHCSFCNQVSNFFPHVEGEIFIRVTCKIFHCQLEFQAYALAVTFHIHDPQQASIRLNCSSAHWYVSPLIELDMCPFTLLAGSSIPLSE